MVRPTHLGRRRDMTVRSNLKATMLGIAAVLLLAPAVLAGTCCANTAIGLDPPSAMPGNAVRLFGMRCLNPDSAGSLPLNLGAFWLAADNRPATGNDEPGSGLPATLPPITEWLPFDSAPDPALGSGEATITVPDLPDGMYQLWWWCVETGPGGGIHYSSGPRLAVGDNPEQADAPATAAETVGRANSSSRPDWRAGLVLALGIAVFLGTARSLHGRRSRRPARR